MILRMKDYPRQLYIGDNLWAVVFCRKVPGESDTVLGLCDPFDLKIYIKMGQTPKERFKTLIHEVLHCWEYEYKLSIPHATIGALENPFFDFLVHNVVSF